MPEPDPLTPDATTSQPHPPPSCEPRDLLTALRTDLEAADYTVEHLEEVLGEAAAAALHRDHALLADRVTARHLAHPDGTAATPAATDTRRDDPQPTSGGAETSQTRRPVGEGGGVVVAVLVRCFVLGLPVPRAALERALPRTGVDGLVRLGLVTEHGADEVRGRCDLRPYGDERHTWWVASDLSEQAVGGPLPTHHVLGIGGASTTLASWAPRPQVDRALDIGTGCGIQVLHLAGHTAYPVVATDLSDRALAHARFTLALNGVGVDLRQGSLLEPVADDQFDLIVSNPPFVITPRGGDVPLYEYRDGGASGDALVAGLVRDLPGRLRPGGIAQLLANWELREGEDWRDRVGGWLAGTGLDAWVVQREEQDVAEYAETWVRDGGHRPGTPEFDVLYAAWLDDFAARGVERVGFGILTLQRPATPREPWVDLDEVRTSVAAPMGPAVLAGLRARTWLAEHTDDELLDIAWQVAEDVTEERIGRPGAPDPQVIQLRQGGGLRRTVRLDTLGAGFVGACDGDLTARQLCSGLAVLTETPVEDVVADLLPLLRDLVKDGLLR